LSTPRLCASCFNVTAEGLEVCDVCAERIANQWWHSRSGKWLSWPNPPPPPPRKAEIPAELRTQVFERDAYRCVDCAGFLQLTCDHVIPESQGGPTTFENLATRCRPCNSSKGTRL
jgi:hypothetical protein